MTLERKPAAGASTQTTASPGVEATEREEHVPQFHVVLLDDDTHSYEYVIEMLTKLFAYSATDAFRRAVEVDTQGRTIVITCELPHAEFARNQIHQFGADWRMEVSTGPMGAVIEPAS